MNTIYIGYWNNSKNQYPNFPMPVPNEKHDNLEDIKSLNIFLSKANERFTKGFSTCRICGCNVGSIEHLLQQGNNQFIVPEGYMHYIQEHFVKLDPNLLLALKY